MNVGGLHTHAGTRTSPFTALGAFAALLLAFTASGCACDGPQATTRGTGAGGSGGAGGSRDIGGECAFVVTSLTPAPESRTALPRATVDLEFSEPVDESTVTPQSVLLRERESKRIVPAEVTVDGTHVRLKPYVPLGSYARYWVEVHQVESATDASCKADYSARIFTAPNFAKWYMRDDLIDVYTYDDEKREVVADFYGAGPDGLLGTADDVESYRSAYFYAEDEDNTNAPGWNGAGADGIWGTTDDRYDFERKLTHTAAGVSSFWYVYYGPDGLAGTGDDTVSAISNYYYDEQDRLSGFCNGASCMKIVYGTGEQQKVTYVDAGPDGQWMTADDVLGPDWVREVADPYGVTLRSETHLLAPDGTPTVSDGSLEQYTQMTVVGEQITETRTYEGPGPDGVWNTVDDLGDRRTTLTYDDAGRLTMTETYLAGPDGLLGTADDTFWNEYAY